MKSPVRQTNDAIKVFALQFSVINSFFKAKQHCFIKDRTLGFFKFL